MLASLTFVGNATTVLRLGAFTVLTDPNFLHAGQRVHLGYGLFSKRLTEPALQPEELPELDLVLLSHLHGDHFDRVARRRLRRDVPIVTTPHAERRLRRWGFGASVPLTTWSGHEVTRGGQRLRITSVPGTHGPAVVRHLLPPVMGSVVELAEDDEVLCRLYVTGDTLYRPRLREIAERFPDLDGMLIHLGGTRILGVLVTMDARQGADLVDLVKPRSTVPIHYDDYTVFTSPLADFVDELRRRQAPSSVRHVARGQTIPLPIRQPHG